MGDDLTAKGVNGTVTLTETTLVIERRGIGQRGTKVVPLSKIGAVQIKPPSALVNGFIQFSITGESARSAGGVGRSMAAANDENSVVFTKKQTAEFEAIRDAVVAKL